MQLCDNDKSSKNAELIASNEMCLTTCNLHVFQLIESWVEEAHRGLIYIVIPIMIKVYSTINEVTRSIAKSTVYIDNNRNTCTERKS